MNETATLPEILRNENERAFDAPWQAQAFALVLKLYESGYFGWEDWVTVFSSHVSSSPQRRGETVNDAYYRQWIDALEQIIVEIGLVEPGATQARTHEWRSAYINTPHGQPIELANAICPPPDVHKPKLRGVPIVVSAALNVTHPVSSLQPACG